MKTLNWGLIGAGDIARKRIAPALRDLENCRFVAVSRKNSDRAAEFAREFGAAKWFADWRSMLKDVEIEAVYLATPVYLHEEQTVAAAEHGKHVLCEKPMALNVAECERMIAACRANQVKLGIAYYRRFYPVVERVKKIIGAGEIGRAVFAQINAFEYFDPPPAHPRFWLLEKEKSGGGPMMDFGCHRLEVLTNLFGKVSKIESIVTNLVFKRDVEDTATASLLFENGTVANLTVSHAAIEPQDTLTVFGTRGTIQIPVLNHGEIRIKTETGDRTESHPPHENVHQPLIADFTRAVLENRAPQVGGETGSSIASLEAEIYRQK